MEELDFGHHMNSVLHNYKYYSKIIDNIVAMATDMEDAESKILNLIKDRHIYTYGHSIRVTEYSNMVSNKLGYNSKKIKIISDSALLHDVGKLAMPLDILNLNRDIKPDEYEIIKMHPFIAAKFLHDSMFNGIRILVLTHHEKEDGTGYPLRIDRDTISEGSRILSIADAFDAMTTKRTYNVPLSIDQALDVLKAKSELGYNGDPNGQQFNKEIVNEFVEVAQSNKEQIKYLINKRY